MKIGIKVCIVEQTIPYRGHLNVKQYIKNKPTKLGVKVYVICDAKGLLYDFILYQGAITEVDAEYLKFGEGAAVVMQLSRQITEPNT